MSKNSPIALKCLKHLELVGNEISGLLHVNPELILKGEFIAIHVQLRGEVDVWVKVKNNLSWIVDRDRKTILHQEQVVWTAASPLPLQSGGYLPISFTFTLSGSISKNILPSFLCNDICAGGRIRYLFRATATRKDPLKLDYRVIAPFSLIPMNREAELPPDEDLTDWDGDWKSVEKVMEIRTGIIGSFSGTQSMRVLIEVPDIPTFPLFKPVPLRLTINCASKLLSSKHSEDPSVFRSPRVPRASNIELTLRQYADMRVRGRNGRAVDILGEIGGFGSRASRSSRESGEVVGKTVSSPCWIADPTKSGKGRWHEQVIFKSNIVFRCTPPFKSSNLNSHVKLGLKVHLPSLGKTLKTVIGPLSLGIGGRQNLSPWTSRGDEPIPSELDLPPSYWEVVQEDEDENGS